MKKFGERTLALDFGRDCCVYTHFVNGLSEFGEFILIAK
jgi:hypothetical protein